MRKTLLTLSLIGLATMSSKAQSFSDDFESYNLSALGPQSPQWTTWSGSDGGSDDVNVVNTAAHSGTKSVYFSSTSSSGGPTDCVLPFGGTYTSGNFVFTTWMKVEAGKGAYFNFQGQSPLGKMYSIDCQLDENGDLTIATTGTLMLATKYTPNTWFELKLDINLSTNTWELKLDGVSKGTFANTNNQIYAIDIYPVNASNSQAGYWMDDVSYVYTPYVLPTLNAALTNLVIENGLVGQTRKPAVTVRNLGSTPITSFDVKVDNNGTIQTQSVTGVNLASYASTTVTFTNPVTLVAGANTVVATVSNVNGTMGDSDPADDSKTVSVTPITPAAGKAVIVEEATGTWCQYCPRGAVFMKRMSEKYESNFIGIAVHNNDPMTFAPYDAGMATKITGYPGALVNRRPVIDPSAMEQDFTTEIVIAPKATMLNGAKYDATTHKLDVSLTTLFSEATSGAYKLACVITEDSIKGSGSKYSQVNAYANNALGPMGGFESLPNPVPATKMVYDHVARSISPSFNGLPNAFPGTIAANASYVHNFTFDLDPSWKYNKIHIVGMLIAPNGRIENGSSVTIDQAIVNGFVNGTSVTGVVDLSGTKEISVQPNPANNLTYVTISTVKESNVEIALYQVNGTMVSNVNYGKLSGANKLSVDVSQLNAGIYLLKVSVNGMPNITKLIVE